MWGTYVDGELDMAGRDPKELRSKEFRAAVQRRRQALERLMAHDPTLETSAPVAIKSAPKKFKDPAAVLFKK